MHHLSGAILLVLGLMPRPDEPSAQTLIVRHDKEKSAVWADNGTLTFFFRGEADQVNVMFNGNSKALKRLPDSDVWVLQLKLPDLNQAVFSYRFLPAPKNNFGQLEIQTWRGPKAPLAATKADKLKGVLSEHQLESKVFSGKRAVTVYLPPDYARSAVKAVMYAADGQATEEFARILEPLIVSGQIPPTAIIGVHNGGYLDGKPDLKNYDPDKDLRAQEYLPWVKPEQFAKHEMFFCKEVRTWAEGKFGAPSRREDRAVFGYSNGGRFAMAMGLRHPDLFGHVFAFSIPGTREHLGDLPKEFNDPPQFHLAAGTWEETFHQFTSALATELKKRQVPVAFSSRVGGHDSVIWHDEFANAILRAFGNKQGSGPLPDLPKKK